VPDKRAPVANLAVESRCWQNSWLSNSSNGLTWCICVCWCAIVSCSDNYLGAEGVREIAEALQANSTLTKLNLSCECRTLILCQRFFTFLLDVETTKHSVCKCVAILGFYFVFVCVLVGLSVFWWILVYVSVCRCIHVTEYVFVGFCWFVFFVEVLYFQCVLVIAFLQWAFVCVCICVCVFANVLNVTAGYLFLCVCAHSCVSLCFCKFVFVLSLWMLASISASVWVCKWFCLLVGMGVVWGVCMRVFVCSFYTCVIVSGECVECVSWEVWGEKRCVFVSIFVIVRMCVVNVRLFGVFLRVFAYITWADQPGLVWGFWSDTWWDHFTCSSRYQEMKKWVVRRDWRSVLVIIRVRVCICLFSRCV